MLRITINNIKAEVEEGLTVIQACEQVGIEIPHFCFHERLKIAGNCRMCLVEVGKSPKPVASCALEVAEGMNIKTNSPMVEKARQGVMEFLLINHPLDCPICDQGGECDLQDQAFKYGKGNSRYLEHKRTVREKNLGPLVKTHMTRCIHCTRCIRFATDIAGVPEIGAIGRGQDMEITSYLDKILTSEISGNIIDLCPVGALTAKPSAFTFRSWELEKTESIDVMDALGSNIRIDSRGMEVMRILPKINEDINEEWISDKARFAYDGLKYQRLDRPYLRKNGKLTEVSWQEALDVVATNLKTAHKDEIAAIAGTTVCCESLFLLKKLLGQLGAENIDANQFGYKIDINARGNYLFNSRISGIEKADYCLLIGANPRLTAPVLNARIGKMVRHGSLKVARIGTPNDQTYHIEELGTAISILEEISAGNNSSDILLPERSSPKWHFIDSFKKADYPMIIVGEEILVREDGYKILGLIYDIVAKYQLVRPNWNGFNILHSHASLTGSLDIGFYRADVQGNIGSGTKDIIKKTQEGRIKILYLLAADNINMEAISKDSLVIYQGHHGDASAARADIILPSPAYTEQDAIYVNIEGRPQYARAAVAPPGIARPDWQIISDLTLLIQDKMQLDKINIDKMQFNNLSEVRALMAKEIPIFANIDEIIEADFAPSLYYNQAKSEHNTEHNILSMPSIQEVKMDYYITDVISRASVTMTRCSKARKEEEQLL